MLTFLEPGALWLLLSLPAIVLLFLIRERRRQQEVSALFLWAEAALSARRRRRISPALLLLLQLLLAALLAFALAQPRFRLGGAPPRVFVVDASASMAATTAGGSRLSAVVAEAEALLSGAGEVAVIRAGLGAAVVQPPTEEHALVRRALRELGAADASADLGAALELARSLAPGAELHLFSDNAPPAGFTDVNVHAVGAAGPNYGISAFDLAYGQLFVSVVGNADTPQNLELVFSEDREGGAEVRTTLLLPAQGQANTSLPLAGATGRYRARLEVSPDDALALDNEAVAGVRALSVRLLGDAPALGRLLAVLPGVTLGAGDADVTVAVPEAVGEGVPAGDAVLFAPPEANPEYTEIAAFERDDPLLRFADLAGVTVAVSSAPLPRPLAEAEVLARNADLEPVLLRWREEGRTLVYFAFYPGQSDLPRRPAFPIVVANAVEEFRGEARVPLGTLLPGGERLSAPGQAERAGRVYTAAPLPAAESRLAVTAVTRSAARNLPQNVGRAETQSEATREATRDPALWLVGGALALLLGEWLLWSRAGLSGAGSRGRRLTGRTRRSAPR